MVHNLDNKPSTPTLLNNRYQVIRVLGEGGFGTTFITPLSSLGQRILSLMNIPESIYQPHLRLCKT